MSDGRLFVRLLIFNLPFRYDDGWTECGG